jgi:tripartite ATP-independent transporter DctP family solute receptor
MKSRFTNQISRRAVLAGAAVTLAMPAILRSTGALAAKTIRISTPAVPDEWQSKALELFKETLEAAMPGAFDVQIFLNATLFAQGTEIAAMQRGNLEVGMTSPQDVATLIPEFSIYTAGYLLRDQAHLRKLFDDSDVGAEYKAKVAEDLDIVILGSQYLGTRHVLLREPKDVQTPADLAGIKLRVPGSDTWQFLGRALGATPTPVSFDEVYLALQTGTVDGFENPIPDIIAAKFYEVSKQIVLTGHMVAPLFFTMSKSFWDGLSADEQAAITAAVRKQSDFADEGTLKTEADGLGFLESQGLVVTTPDVAAFRSHVQKAFLDSEYAQSWPAGLLERINAV